MQPETRRKIEELRRPAVHVVPSTAGTGSWLGGLPMAAKPFVWPQSSGVPMSFMGQFLLDELPQVDEQLSLPSDGYLYFFFSSEDLEGCQVIWLPDASGLTEIPAPPQPEPEPAKGLKKLFGLKPKPRRFEVYKKLNVEFRPIQTYPTAESDLVEPLLDEDEDNEKLISLREAVYGPLSAHHFFGYPDPEQGDDMEIECELASAELQIKRTEAYSDPKVKKAAKDWRLLLQLDEDGATGFEFVDVGKVYFWIRTQDAAARDFSRVHAICQFG